MQIIILVVRIVAVTGEGAYKALDLDLVQVTGCFSHENSLTLFSVQIS